MINSRINPRFAVSDYKKHLSYRTGNDLLTDGMSVRTYWEIILGVKCQVAYREGIGGKDIWTIWLRDADWDYALQRFKNSRYKDEDVQFVVGDVVGDDVFHLVELPELRYILGFRLAYDPKGTDKVVDTYEVYTRTPCSPPGRPIFESELPGGGWELLTTIVGDKAWRDEVDLTAIMFGPEEGQWGGKDTKVRNYINDIYQETDYHIWVYSSEDGFIPRGYTKTER